MNTFKLALISLFLGLLGSFSGYSQEEERSAAPLSVPLSHLPVTPSVVNTGSVNVEMINLFYYSIAAQYDWRISSRWTLGGMVSGGVNAMAAVLSGLPYPPLLHSEVKSEGDGTSTAALGYVTVFRCATIRDFTSRQHSAIF